MSAEPTHCLEASSLLHSATLQVRSLAVGCSLLEGNKGLVPVVPRALWGVNDGAEIHILRRRVLIAARIVSGIKRAKNVDLCVRWSRRDSARRHF